MFAADGGGGAVVCPKLRAARHAAGPGECGLFAPHPRVISACLSLEDMKNDRFSGLTWVIIIIIIIHILILMKCVFCISVCVFNRGTCV